MKRLVAIVSVLLFLGPAVGCKRQNDVDAEKAVISKLTAGWFAAELRHDIDASVAFLSSDAIIHAEGTPAIVGTDAIRAMYVELFKVPFNDWVIEPRTVVVSKSGDLAYDIGSFKMVIASQSGRQLLPYKSTIIYRKLAGNWKVVACSFSSDAPPVPAAK